MENTRLPDDALNEIYLELTNLIGYDNMLIIYQHYRGQQITFPIRITNREYGEREILQKYDGTNAKELAKMLNYSERWVRKLIKRGAINNRDNG